MRSMRGDGGGVDPANQREKVGRSDKRESFPRSDEQLSEIT